MAAAYHSRQQSPFVAWDDAQIARTRVLVLGAGAVGCGTSMLLARMGVARLTLVDYDTVEASNLNRQMLFTKAHAEAGARKVDAAAETLRAIHCTRTEVVPVHCDALREWGTTIIPLMRDSDLVVQAIDQGGAFDFATRAAAQQLGIPVIEASSYMHSAEAAYHPLHRRCQPPPTLRPRPSLYGGSGECEPEERTLPPADFCFACPGGIDGSSITLLRWVSPREMTDAAGDAAAGVPPGLGASRGAAYLPADDKGNFSNGSLGSHALVCSLACTTAVYLWAQDVNRAAQVGHHLIMSFGPTFGEPGPDLATTTPPELHTRMAKCAHCGDVPLSCRDAGLRALAFHSEPVVLRRVAGSTRLFAGPGADASPALGALLTKLRKTPELAALATAGAADGGAAAAAGGAGDGAGAGAAPAAAAPVIASDAAAAPLQHVGGPLRPDAVLPMERLDAVPGSNGLYLPCVPAPDLDAAAYLAAEAVPASGPAVRALPGYLSGVLCGGLLKGPTGTVHAVRSGGRSAVLNAGSTDASTPPIRLKGCGNIVVLDPKLGALRWPGFPVRDITVAGAGDEVGLAHAAMVSMAEAGCLEGGMPHSRMKEIRGCAFEHTALREQVMTARVAALLARHGMRCGNTPLAVTRYPAFSEEATPENADDVDAAGVPKLCGAFATVGDKRLSANVLAGIEAMLPLLVATGGVGGAAVAAARARELLAASLPDGKRMAAAAAAGAAGAIHGDPSGFKPTGAVNRSAGASYGDPSGFKPTGAVNRSAGFKPADLVAPASIAAPGASWPACSDLEPLAAPSAMAALKIHPHWRPLWTRTVVALAAALGPHGAHVWGCGGALAYAMRRLGAEAGAVMRVMRDGGVSWGSFLDMNPPLEPHCNAHANNMVVVAEALAAGGPDPSPVAVPAFDPATGAPLAAADASEAASAADAVAVAAKPQLIAPVDFDMAFCRDEYRSSNPLFPSTRGKDDAEEAGSVWDDLVKGEPEALEVSLSSAGVNTGVAARPTAEATAVRAAELAAAAGASAADAAAAGKSAATLLHGLRDTLVAGYREGLAGGAPASSPAVGPTGAYAANAELATRLLLRLACMVTDAENS